MDKDRLSTQLGSFTTGRCRMANRRPIYDGNVTLIIRDRNKIQRRTAVFMKLFEQCPKHYAVLYRKDDCEHQYGFFDSINCIVKPVPGNDCQFEVTEKDGDTGLRFETPSSELAGKWMESFRCNKYCPYSPENKRAFRTSPVRSPKTQLDGRL